MAGPLHAFALVALALATAVAVAVFFARPTVKRALLAVAVGLGTAFHGMVLGAHACNAGNPFAQWLIPAVCGALCVLFIPSKKALPLIVGVSLVFSIGLSLHYADAVHGEYIGHAEQGESEWHSPLTGLYRRPPGNRDPLPS